MGAHHSSPETCTKEEIADIVSSYGKKYQEYSHLVKENGMDGSYLSSLNQQEFGETLDDLQITARLHRRKLLNEFQKWFLSDACVPRLSTSSSSNSSSGSPSVTTTTTTSMESSSVASNNSKNMDNSLNNSICFDMDAIKFFSAIEEQNMRLQQSLVHFSSNNTKTTMTKKMRSPPEHKAALVLTHIDGSTSLWKANPGAMQKAVKQHDTILQKLIADHLGYKIAAPKGCEGCAVAFHQAVEALSFSLCLQQAMNAASWSQDLLDIDEASDNGAGRRGLRVCVSVHMGAVETIKDPSSGQITSYSGAAWTVAESLESIAVGGQIITSYDTWSEAVQLKDSLLGSPMVATLGVHKVKKRGNSSAPTHVVGIPYLEVAPASLNIVGNSNTRQ